MKRVLVASLGVLAGTYGLEANAQELGQPGYLQKTMAAPASAFEIGISGIYNQGWGNITDTTSVAAATGRNLQDVANAGLGGELDFGYRATPSLAMGVFGTLTEFDQDSRLATGTNVRSVTSGVQGQWFFRPYRSVSPWVSVGSAYRGYWVVPEVGGITSRQGWQIARLQVGVDLRASRELAVGPYVGGSIDMFLSEKVPGRDSRNLDGPPVAFFFTAGLAARFDIGGRYVQPGGAVAAR